METLEEALGRLEGVKSAKMGDSKNEYKLLVLENKAILPSKIQKGIPDDYVFKGVSIETIGTIEKKDDVWTFAARGSKQKFLVKPNDDLKKLFEAGKTTLKLAGGLTEPEEKDGKKPLPVIDVTEAKEVEKK